MYGGNVPDMPYLILNEQQIELPAGTDGACLQDFQIVDLVRDGPVSK